MAATVNAMERTRERIPRKVDEGITQFIPPGPPITPVSNDQSLDFDGVDEYVKADSYPGPQGSDWTVNIWIKVPASHNTQEPIGYWGSNGQGKICIMWVLASGKIRGDFSALNCDTNSSVNGIFDGNWHMVTWSCPSGADTDGFLIYVDGVNFAQTATSTATISITDTSNLEFNVARHSNHSVLGEVTEDEVSVWTTELTAAEILAVYNEGSPIDLTTDADDYASSANLDMWWRFESDSGTGTGNILDASTNSNVGTTNNMESGDFISDVP